MTTTMNMLPNDHHPGPRCSCAECQRRYPEVSAPAQPTSKEQLRVLYARPHELHGKVDECVLTNCKRVYDADEVDELLRASLEPCGGVTGWRKARCTKPTGHDGPCEFSPGTARPPLQNQDGPRSPEPSEQEGFGMTAREPSSAQSPEPPSADATDAARYRWLRVHVAPSVLERITSTPKSLIADKRPEALDAEIDLRVAGKVGAGAGPTKSGDAP